MPRPLTGKATAELRNWKRTGNRFEGFIFNDKNGIYLDNTWRKFDPSDYVRIADYAWLPYMLLQTHGYVFQLNRDQEDAD